MKVGTIIESKFNKYSERMVIRDVFVKELNTPNKELLYEVQGLETKTVLYFTYEDIMDGYKIVEH